MLGTNLCHLEPIFDKFGGHLGSIFIWLGVPRRPGTKNGAGKPRGQKNVNFRSPHRRTSSFPFWRFCNHVPELSDVFGIWVACPISERFFYGFLDPWKCENHAKPWEGLTKLRFGHLQKKWGYGCNFNVILVAILEPFGCQSQIFRDSVGISFLGHQNCDFWGQRGLWATPPNSG